MTAQTQFAAETIDHEMTVLHDDGLYRHLRFAKPGTGLWSFNLVTWPHHLVINGDVGNGWTFSAAEDMVEFFGTARSTVNLPYWWEKLPPSQRGSARSFSEDRLFAIAADDIAGWGMATRDQEAAIAHLRFLWDHEGGHAHAYREIVDDFTWIPTITTHDVISGSPQRFADTDEWDAEDFDHHFQLACHAIAYGIRQYREAARR